MEGMKSLIMCLLVLGLVLQQEKIQVEAKSCCPSTTARNVYNSCRFAEELDVLNFCKLGCTSSVCSIMNTFAGNEEGNRCNDACYRFCTKEAETVTIVS
uniref:Uncharacterized protein n=1 Tax=Oryza glumipatula TaxID=40148 RepID=A0A0E0AA88_9ORYZ